MELMHIDLIDSMQHTTLRGARYFMLIIVNFSRKVWVYLCLAKSEAFSTFQKWVSLVETKTSKKVRKIRSSNGG